MSKLNPITPGELLSEEFLKPMGITNYRLAKEIGVPAQRVGDIVAGKRSISADTDLRMCRFFGLSNGYWLRAQAAYDTEVAERSLGPKLGKIRHWSTVGAQQRIAADGGTSSVIVDDLAKRSFRRKQCLRQGRRSTSTIQSSSR